MNTALDSPTNFFTAQALDNRASDISNLLDGIGNGVQVLQAANTGITSLYKLVDTAKSIANQALQTTVGYSAKSNVSTTIAGATAIDLRGTTTYTSATAASNVLYSGTAGGTTAACGDHDARRHLRGLVTGSVVNDTATSPAAITTATLLNNNRAVLLLALERRAVQDGDRLLRQRPHHHLQGGCGSSGGAAAPRPASASTPALPASATDGNGNSLIYIGASSTTSTATVGDVLRAIDLASGVRIIGGRLRRRRTTATNSGQTVSSSHGRRSQAADLDRWRSQRQRQGRLPQGLRYRADGAAAVAAQAACTVARNCRISPSNRSASPATASASWLTSAAVVRAPVVAPATRTIASAPPRASPEA